MFATEYTTDIQRDVCKIDRREKYFTSVQLVFTFDILLQRDDILILNEYLPDRLGGTPHVLSIADGPIWPNATAYRDRLAIHRHPEP